MIGDARLAAVGHAILVRWTGGETNSRGETIVRMRDLGSCYALTGLANKGYPSTDQTTWR